MIDILNIIFIILFLVILIILINSFFNSNLDNYLNYNYKESTKAPFYIPCGTQTNKNVKCDYNTLNMNSCHSSGETLEEENLPMYEIPLPQGYEYAPTTIMKFHNETMIPQTYQPQYTPTQPPPMPTQPPPTQPPPMHTQPPPTQPPPTQPPPTQPPPTQPPPTQPPPTQPPPTQPPPTQPPPTQPPPTQPPPTQPPPTQPPPTQPPPVQHTHQPTHKPSTGMCNGVGDFWTCRAGDPNDPSTYGSLCTSSGGPKLGSGAQRWCEDRCTRGQTGDGQNDCNPGNCMCVNGGPSGTGNLKQIDKCKVAEWIANDTRTTDSHCQNLALHGDSMTPDAMNTFMTSQFCKRKPGTGGDSKGCWNKNNPNLCGGDKNLIDPHDKAVYQNRIQAGNSADNWNKGCNMN